MAFLGTKNLTKLLKGSDIIIPFDESKIKNGAYELSLGNQVFQTDTKPRSIKNLNDNQEIYIEPGQFALLLTEEIVKTPKDKIAFISIKAGVKFKGLVNVSGFHVDPGFEGKLLFSVYNAGPSTIVLSRGTKYFPIWFAELNESQDYMGLHSNQMNIPNEPVESLSQGELASSPALSKRIDDNQKELDKRIGLVEKDHKANNYIAVTALGIVIALLLKFAFDWYVYNTGLDKGYVLKQKEITADSIVNQSLVQKRSLMLEIDSLEKIKKDLKDIHNKTKMSVTHFFDSDFCELEQLPRNFTVNFDSMEIGSKFKTRVSINGIQVGDVIDDNSKENDGYRFHDIFHYTFAAFLGWSPCTRSMMKRKRKSDPEVDEMEDGARATITEEAISLILFNKAKQKSFFEGKNAIDPKILTIIKEMTSSFEVTVRSKEDWTNTILKGYSLFRSLKENNGGRIHFDMLSQSAVYEIL